MARRSTISLPRPIDTEKMMHIKYAIHAFGDLAVNVYLSESGIAHGRAYGHFASGNRL
jgi:hypothetical protein